VTTLAVEPIVGKPERFRPGHVAIRLYERDRRAYRRLYGLVFPLADVPALKDGDFDGRVLTLTRPELQALNHALASLDRQGVPKMRGASEDQEQALTGHSKKMQFLS
jgi:hypothetical protein